MGSHAGVVVTGDKLPIAGVFVTGNKLLPVPLTPAITFYIRIYSKIFVKTKCVHVRLTGVWAQTNSSRAFRVFYVNLVKENNTFPSGQAG